MSIDSTSSSSVHRKKTLTSTLSQSDNYPFSKHSLKDCPTRSQSTNRLSVSEESSGDILTNLSTPLPYNPHQQINVKRNRRFSELKPSLLQDSNSDRRNSTSQISFSSLLPNPFRSNKHHHKNTAKDETNTTIQTSDNSSWSHHNDTMTMKTESFSSLKPSNIVTNGSRTNLSFSHDRSPSFILEDSSSSTSSTSSLFILDANQSEPRSAETLMLKLHTPLCVSEIYREHFFEYFHTNYCGEFEVEGPFIASLRYVYTKPTITDNTSDTTCQARAIIRIPSRNHDVSATIDGTNEDNILQMLFNKVNLSTVNTFKPIGDPKANEKIYLFDKSNDERQNCKVGLIYQCLDQTNEYDIFSNDNLTSDLLEFLQMLADRVPLKGFNKYRGDLDIKDDLHGDHSYYTQYENHEIMFNIAPLIPSTKANGQCIERKGLVGNSFVCIVFQETDAEFSPDLISGKVAQVYITVQPTRIDEQVYYKIGIWHRCDVTSIIDPPGGIYQCDQSFRDYFLTLLLNSINVAIESPRLRFRIAEQRQRLKQEDLRKLSLNLLVGQTLDTTPDAENIKDQRSDSRIENIVGSTSDIIIPNAGRTSPAASTKKRTFSKIFGVFTNRSGTINTPSPLSIPPNLHDISPVTPPSPESTLTRSRTLPSPVKEPIKRAASVKFRPAPPPPVPPRLPVPQTKTIASTHSPSSSHSSTSNDNILLEEIRRTRSNSSPDDRVNSTPKLRPLTGSRISEEIDDTNSSVDNDFDDDSSEDEKIEHRQTLTEPPLLLPSNTNS